MSKSLFPAGDFRNVSAPRRLVLASTSRYRAELLQRLQLPFEALGPEVDETLIPGETPTARAGRLAAAKARAVAATSAAEPATWVIGSDQVASLAGEILRKPGSTGRARLQLEQLSGQRARFDTAVALIATRDGRLSEHLDTTFVQFRTLDARTIERYLASEFALDCAGSFKSEGLGIALLDRLESSDPTALVGLPLIWTAAALRDAGFVLP